MLRRRNLAEYPNRPLARRIRRLLMQTLPDSRHRRYVHDRPAARPSHLRYRVLCPQKHPLRVHLKHPIPLRRRPILYPNPVYDNRRVVHQHIQAAVLGNRRLNGRLPVRLIGNIQVNIQRLAAQFIDFGLNLPPLRVQDVPQHDLRPLLREQPRLRRALPPRAPANQRHLAVQLAHYRPPFA